MNRRSLLLFVIAILHLAVARFPTNELGASAPALPDRLNDREFWSLVTEMSEPNGQFRSDNLLSNEIFFQYVLNDLAQPTRMNRVYLGVGPEQNFTYIAAVKPKMAFIVDVRRGNLHLHLMYKAIFEMSSDRADFVFRLFSRKRPAGLAATASANDIFDALYKQEQSEALFKENLKRLLDHLTKKRNLGLSPEDLVGIEYVYGNFSWHGPGLSVLVDGRRRRRPQRAHLLGPDGGRRRQGADAELPGQRRQFQGDEGSAREEPARAGGGELRRAESAARGRPLPPRARRHGGRVLSLERRAGT